ncbi:MAG: hypothetical protein M5R40_10830 [Anaerolineae bacterium]|nr:hypothetical protein [Anaerolineae bacterium]
MAFLAQVILVPATTETIGPWVDATFRYQRAFRGVSVTANPDPENVCRHTVITVVGGTDAWGRDMATEVRQACPDASIDEIDASNPHELRRVLDARAETGARFGAGDPLMGHLFLRWPTDHPQGDAALPRQAGILPPVCV